MDVPSDTGTDDVIILSKHPYTCFGKVIGVFLF